MNLIRRLIREAKNKTVVGSSEEQKPTKAMTHTGDPTSPNHLNEISRGMVGRYLAAAEKSKKDLHKKKAAAYDKGNKVYGADQTAARMLWDQGMKHERKALQRQKKIVLAKNKLNPKVKVLAREENLQELSPQTLRDYIRWAKVDIEDIDAVERGQKNWYTSGGMKPERVKDRVRKDMAEPRDGKNAPSYGKTLANRQKGVVQARLKLGHKNVKPRILAREENLQEISLRLARRYINRARHDKNKIASDLHTYNLSQSGPDAYPDYYDAKVAKWEQDAYRKLNNRGTGMQLAKKKINAYKGVYGKPRVYATEENLQELDRANKYNDGGILGRYIQRTSSTGGDPELEKLRAAALRSKKAKKAFERKAANRHIGWKRAWDKLEGPPVKVYAAQRNEENLQELNRGKRSILARYVAKALSDEDKGYVKKRDKYYALEPRGDNNKAFLKANKKLNKVVANRRKGIKLANRKQRGPRVTAVSR